MRNEIFTRFLIVVVIAIVSGIFATQKFDAYPLTLGLDLAGGTELDYRVDLTDARAQNADDDPLNDVSIDSIAESVRDALETRVNPAGVGEIVVQRSQVDEEEHILIQMPPSSNVDKAKQEAERDNRLDFFKEDPALETKYREELSQELSSLTPAKWDSFVGRMMQRENVIYQKGIPRFKDEVQDPTLADKVFTAPPGTILPEVIETKTEMEVVPGPDGQLSIRSFPADILGLVYVKERPTEQRETTVGGNAHARHILIGYSGADRVPEDIPYASAEEARAKAEELLAQLKDGGDFEALAKEFSTGPSGPSGGDLGTFKRADMVPAFSDAVFGMDAPGLVPEIVETSFGFHVIEVLKITPDRTESVPEEKVTYELIGFDRNEIIWVPTDLSGKQLERAAVGYDQVGSPLIDLYFDAEGGDLFTALTGELANKKCNGGPCRLGIKVGGKWMTQPTVREKIFGRQSQITGQFQFEEAKALADGLNLGAIDAPVILSGQMTIEAALGTDQMHKSLKAGAMGLGATLIFMILLYRWSGIVATIALLIYTAIFITILKVWPNSLGGPIVLTLSGAAGIALSLGLAVDGNILIFERMKEELRNGRSQLQAVDLGFDRAWAAIRDSNLTTLITCLILYNLGSAMMKGFAITLIVGTLLSMFTAVIVSRNLLRFFMLFPVFQHPWLYGISDKKNKK